MTNCRNVELLLDNTPNFTYMSIIYSYVLYIFQSYQRTFFFPSALRHKVTTIFTIFQNFQLILSKFIVNRLYRYFYGIIFFIQLSNLIYKSLYLYIYK